MEQYKKEEVIIMFNKETGKWEVLEYESGVVIDSAQLIITLVNRYDYLK